MSIQDIDIFRLLSEGMCADYGSFMCEDKMLVKFPIVSKC